MANKKHMYFDKTEIMLMYTDGNAYKSMNLTYDKIREIKIEKCYERKIFKKVPSERIQIITKVSNIPIQYTRLKEKDYFEEYAKELSKFAKNNKIILIDTREKI